MTRTLTTLNLGMLALLAMTAASEASIQARLDSAPAIFVARASSLEVATVPARDIDLAPCPAVWGGNADSVIQADFRWSRSDSMGPISACDLANGAPLRRLSDPEPSTLAIWSLIGLCWAGASCWRRRRTLTLDGSNRGPQRVRRSRTRPPWPEHVRAAIREIIERGCPR